MEYEDTYQGMYEDCLSSNKALRAKVTALSDEINQAHSETAFEAQEKKKLANEVVRLKAEIALLRQKIGYRETLMDGAQQQENELRAQIAALEVEYANVANDYAAYSTQSQARFAELNAENKAALELLTVTQADNAALRQQIAALTARLNVERTTIRKDGAERPALWVLEVGPNGREIWTLYELANLQWPEALKYTLPAEPLTADGAAKGGA